MKLTDLEPQFFKYEMRIEPYELVDGDEKTWRERGCPVKQMVGPREFHINVDTFAEAQAVRFQCPKCFEKNKGPIGTHEVHVTFEGRGVPDGQGIRNGQGRFVKWNVSGSGYSDLTLSPSIAVLAGCYWHGFITNGEAVTC